MKSNKIDFSNDIYKYIFENSGISMFIIEKDMTVCMINKKFVQEIGYSKSEIERKIK